jgi:hypothetical protein
VAIPVNYTNEFWEILEATSYYKKYTKYRGLGMPFVLFPCATCVPAQNNRCGPSSKRVGHP